MTLRLADPDGLVDALARALAGGPPIVPVAEGGNPPSFADGEDDADDLAVVVGTSGSTGTPRGVQLTRSALLAAADAGHDRLGGPGRWSCGLPLFYVAGLMTAVRAWRSGEALSRVRSDLSDLCVLPGMRNYVSVVVAQLHAALAEPSRVDALARCDAVLVGGSAIPSDLLRRARAAGIPVVTSYGMTETCGGCVYDGRPLDGVSVAVDDDARISLAGPMLFSGYRHQPEQTARVLREGRFFTEDRGTLTDGRLTVLGRMDEVVVTGGVNVDLAAAQRAADAAFGPAAVVLLGIPDERFGVRIVAITAADSTLADLNGRLSGRLRADALPRELRVVPRIPLTATGKPDRQRLERDWVEGAAAWRR